MEPADFVILVFALVLSFGLAALAVLLNLVGLTPAFVAAVSGAFVLAAVVVGVRRIVG